MNLSVRANLFGGQFFISHTLNCSDFKSALIATSLMDNLKEHKLYGRVTIAGYDTPINERILSAMIENPGYGDGYVYNFTGIIINISLPHECVSDDYCDFDKSIDKDKRLRLYDHVFKNLLRFYNCFLENFMSHMITCGMTAFFQYDIFNDVMPMKHEARATIMIPTFDSADGAFFDITKFSALDGVITSAPHFDPLDGYEKTKTILKIPEGFHLESITLHPYTTGKEETDEWYVLIPNKKTESESN